MSPAEPWTARAVQTSAGHTLHVEHRGEGAPVVVFEAGLGISRNSWGLVAPATADRTTAVVYDRAGIGRSPAATGARDLAALAADLVDVLDDIGRGPFVLVGHSWGGPIIRCAAAAVPDRIAGLVLVDPSDERCDLFFSKGNERQTRLLERWGVTFARTGAPRLVAKGFAKKVPEPWATNMRTDDGTVAAVQAQIAELHAHIADLQRLRDHPLVLPAVPVTIISGTKASFLERGRRPALVAAHSASAAALPRGRHVTADRSSHYVPITEPELVVAEIDRILEGAQQ